VSADVTSAASAQALGVSDIGICLRAEYSDGYSMRRVGELSRLADELGYHSVWFAESWGHDSLVLASHVAAITNRVKVGTAVINVFSRTPAQLAMAAATIAELHPQRFLLGLGTSTKALVEGWHGLPFERPVRRMREVIEYLRQALSGEVVNYEGEIFRFSKYRLRNAPEQSPPPLLAAGLGPSSIETIGHVADGWIPYLLPARGVGEAVSALRDAAREAGRDPHELMVVALIVAAVGDEEHAAEVVRRHLAYYLGAMGPHYREFVSRYGFAGIPRRIAEAWRDGRRDEARRLVTDDMVRHLGVLGPAKTIPEQLTRYLQAGVDVPVLFFPGAESSTQVAAGLRELSEVL